MRMKTVRYMPEWIFIRIENLSVRKCAFELKFAGMVSSDFHFNRRLVNENENRMVRRGSDWFGLIPLDGTYKGKLVRTEEISCPPGDRGVPPGSVLLVLTVLCRPYNLQNFQHKRKKLQ